MVCGRCGHRNEAAARFCSSCGANLSSGDETTLSHPAFDEHAEEDLEPVPDLPAGAGQLEVARGPNAGSTYLVAAPSVSVGPHPESDVFLDDITVSRRHSVIQRTDDGFAIRDVDSLNGTYVNRRRVEEADLHDGDEVQIGRFHLTFRTGG